MPCTQYCNPTLGNHLTIEMALLRAPEEEKANSKKDKGERASHNDRWKVATPHPCTGTWIGKEYEIKYVAEMAGNLEMHLWAIQKEDSEDRIALPGSPFIIHCQAGKAHAGGSSVRGFTRVLQEVEQVGRSAGPSPQANARPNARVPLQRRSSKREMRSSCNTWPALARTGVHYRHPLCLCAPTAAHKWHIGEPCEGCMCRPNAG